MRKLLTLGSIALETKGRPTQNMTEIIGACGPGDLYDC